MLKTNELYLNKLDSDAKRAEAGRVNRPTSAAGSPGVLDADLLGGMRRSVRNSQQRLALEYIAEIIEAQAAQITELQEALASRDTDGPSEPDMPAGPIPGPEPTIEAEPVEERKKQNKRQKPEVEVEAEPTE